MGRGRALAVVVMALLLASTARAVGWASSSLLLAVAEEPGVRLVVRGQLLDRQGRPVVDAEIHAYQTDASGRYTLERAMDEPHARLAGRLHTDGEGRFELRTIRPGGYPQAVRLGDRDRHIPAHIHLDIRAEGHAERRAQLVFADDPELGDRYWADWVAAQHHPVLTLTAAADGVEGAVTIILE